MFVFGVRRSPAFIIFATLLVSTAWTAEPLIEDFDLEAPRTRTVATLFKAMGVEKRKVLLVSRTANENLVLSARNLPTAAVSHVGELNAYQVLNSEVVVFTRSGLDALVEVLGR